MNWIFGAALIRGGGLCNSLCLEREGALMPDGFTMVFWQFYWSFNEEGCLDSFVNSMSYWRIVRNLNSNLLVLISKKCNGKDLRDLIIVTLREA